MDYPCENEINVRNDYALRFGVVIKPAPVIEYLKTIASLTGASHILGVFEDNDCIKIYFDDKKYVDTIIRSGVHIMGHHVKVDYVVPPGSKVILSNIDPVISNQDLIKLVSMFGSVVSPVFRSPITDDIELCHIDHGVRYLYMNLNMVVPETLEFKYGDQLCKINIKLDDSFPAIGYVKNEPVESNTTDKSSSSAATPSDNSTEPINIEDDLVTNPVVVSVQSTSDEINSAQQNEIFQPLVEINKPVGNRRDLIKARCAKLKTTQIKKVRHNVRYKTRGKRFKIGRRALVRKVTYVKKNLNTQPSSSVCSSNPESSSALVSDVNDSFINENSMSILDEDKLKLFLEEARCHRAPIELVKKYLGSDFDSNTLRCFISQLSDLKTKTDDYAFKVRIRRLINNLKIFLSA